jgi:hypothetical protein
MVPASPCCSDPLRAPLHLKPHYSGVSDRICSATFFAEKTGIQLRMFWAGCFLPTSRTPPAISNTRAHLEGNRGLILQMQILHRPLEERDAAAGQIHRAPSSTCHPSAPASSQRTPQRLLQVFYKMCREHPEVMKRHMVCRLSNRISIQIVLRMLTPAGWPCLSVSRVKFRATFYPVLLSMGPARLPASQRRSHAGPTSFVSFCIR